MREEHCRLKEIPAKHSIPTSVVQAKHNGRQTNSPKPSEVAQAVAPTDKDAKVALLRTLFRGRDDVCAERWRTKEVQEVPSSNLGSPTKFLKDLQDSGSTPGLSIDPSAADQAFVAMVTVADFKPGDVAVTRI